MSSFERKGAENGPNAQLDGKTNGTPPEARSLLALNPAKFVDDAQFWPMPRSLDLPLAEAVTLSPVFVDALP